MVAALAARWLGSRLGATAGLTLLTSVHVLLPDRGATAEMLFCAAVSAAMGAFALANVPRRLPLIDHWGTRWGFYAAAGGSFVLAGPVGPAFILAGCLLFLVLSADSRGLRFFACPPGIAVFALLAALRLALPRDLLDTWVASSGVSGGVSGTGVSLPDLLRWLGMAGLPWTPLVVPTVAVGLHQGHYATPVWRFFGCWMLGPTACCLLLWVAGVTTLNSARSCRRWPCCRRQGWEACRSGAAAGGGAQFAPTACWQSALSPHRSANRRPLKADF